MRMYLKLFTGVCVCVSLFELEVVVQLARPWHNISN